MKEVVTVRNVRKRVDILHSRSYHLMKIVMDQVNILHWPRKTYRKPSLRHLTLWPARKFYEKLDKSLERFSAGNRPILIARTSKKCIGCRKWKTEGSCTLPARELICNKSDHKSKRREENQWRRHGQGIIADVTGQASARRNPKHAQSVCTQYRIRSNSQTVKSKLQRCEECEVSGSEDQRLF